MKKLEVSQQPGGVIDLEPPSVTVPFWILSLDVAYTSKFIWSLIQAFKIMGKEITQDSLADYSGLSLKTISRAVKELESAGALRMKRVGLGKPNTYVLIYTDPEENQNENLLRL